MKAQDVMKLIEANKLMSEVIDELYGQLAVLNAAADVPQAVMDKIETAATIMADYE